MDALSSLEGCKGMMELYEECLGDRHYSYCDPYADIAPWDFSDVRIETVVMQKSDNDV